MNANASATKSMRKWETNPQKKTSENNLGRLRYQCSQSGLFREETALNCFC